MVQFPVIRSMSFGVQVQDVLPLASEVFVPRDLVELPCVNEIVHVAPGVVEQVEVTVGLALSDRRWLLTNVPDGAIGVTEASIVGVVSEVDCALLDAGPDEFDVLLAGV